MRPEPKPRDNRMVPSTAAIAHSDTRPPQFVSIMTALCPLPHWGPRTQPLTWEGGRSHGRLHFRPAQSPLG